MLWRVGSCTVPQNGLLHNQHCWRRVQSEHCTCNAVVLTAAELRPNTHDRSGLLLIPVIHIVGSEPISADEVGCVRVVQVCQVASALALGVRVQLSIPLVSRIQEQLLVALLCLLCPPAALRGTISCLLACMPQVSNPEVWPLLTFARSRIGDSRLRTWEGPIWKQVECRIWE